MAEYPTAEHQRLAEDAKREQNWKRWGPYLAERQWGTVREDYSSDGDAWNYLPHDHARSRAYRWGEDGLLGITDRQCRLCFAVALWNEQDSILKERLFGLTGPEGNHGEDVKELYYYLDATPTHAYLKALYKYPQAAFPYDELVAENARRGLDDPEYELADAGVFDENRYFDVVAEYGKAGPDDVAIRLTVTNRGPDAAPLHVLPTLWFRNTWSWGCRHEGCTLKPRMARSEAGGITVEQDSLGRFHFEADASNPPLEQVLFTDNETNTQRLFDEPTPTPYVKDAFHEAVVAGRDDAVNPKEYGTKVAHHYRVELGAGESVVLRFRLYGEAVAESTSKDGSPGRFAPPRGTSPSSAPGGARRPCRAGSIDEVIHARREEADTFYGHVIPHPADSEAHRVQRQAYAGLVWTNQFYHYSVRDWLDGDPQVEDPPPERLAGRNAEWQYHLFNRDVISMPDTWEYPWYAAWDLAFHMVPYALIDPDFAKSQLTLLLREWYMHPNGQIPAYEFAFGDVNPPVHAWAVWRVYKLSATRGERDLTFLAAAFHKLLINFTWWVNRKDPQGNNLFAGGFLGLDNIGVFDRSQPLPEGHTLDQADGTAWMAFYALTMLAMALELAVEDPAYEGVASKFFEHFVAIADAINTLDGEGLWDEADGFYYDHIRTENGSTEARIRSMVGLIPLFAVEVLDSSRLDQLPRFRKRMEWFLEHRQDLSSHVTCLDGSLETPGLELLALPTQERLQRVLQRMLDESEFLSPHGLRSMSRRHLEEPYGLEVGDRYEEVRYTPAESDTHLFGGNSNWRGPIWFPLNYLMIESLEKYHRFYGDTLKVECPTGSGKMVNLREAAREIAGRLAKLFLPDGDGARPCHGDDARYRDDPHFRDLILFYEYFDGDTGRGCGASHQTGWTALVAKLLRDLER